MTQENDLQEETFILPDEALAEGEAGTGATAAAPYVVTRERLEELNANPDLMTAEEASHVNPYILEGKEWPEPAVVTETAEEIAEREANEAAAAAAAAPVVTAGAADEADTEDDDSLEVSRIRIQSVTELRDAHKAALAPLNAILDKPAPEDEFSDEYKAWEREQRTALREKSKLQESFQDNLAEATISGESRAVAVRESKRFMSSFDTVAKKHGEVALARPFEAANAEYATWLNRLVTESGITEGTDAQKREAAYAKFQNDPEFAAKVPAPKDLQQVQILNAARELVEAVGGKRSLDGAVLEVLSSRGLLNARVDAASKAASQASAAKTQEALARARTAPVTAPVTGTSGKSPRVLTAPVDVESATAYMTNLLDKRGKGLTLTKFETMYEDQAKEKLGLDKIR